MAAPLVSLNARTSSAFLARPSLLILCILDTVTPPAGKGIESLNTASDIVGATSSRIQCVTASAIGQRSAAVGDRVIRRPSAESTASNATTCVAVQSSGCYRRQRFKREFQR